MYKEQFKRAFLIFIPLVSLILGITYTLLISDISLVNMTSMNILSILDELINNHMHIIGLLLLLIVISLVASWWFARVSLLEIKLEENRKHLEGYMDMTSSWFWQTDKNLKFTTLSSKLNELTGIQPSMYIGTHISKLIKVQARQEINPIILIKKHESFKDALFIVNTPHGKTIEFSVTARPYYKGKVFQGYQGIARDNTNYKNISNQLQQKEVIAEQYSEMLSRSLKELKISKIESNRAVKSKSSFLANMSHEIRTPLNAITGFIALLMDEEEDTRKLKYLSTIKSASHSLLHTINDILDFTKIESGKLSIDKVDFYPYKEISTLLELFQLRASEKYIDLKLDYNPNIPEILHSDILRIKQVIGNLLSNAIKFTPNSGEITLSLTHNNGIFSVSVTDNGIGVPDDKLEHIFNSFEQADDSTVREYGGSGLGLSISSQLIGMLDGTLAVESKEREGSKFYFDIPVNEGHYVFTEDNLLTLDFILKGHILIVEDVVANQMFIELVMQKEGLSYDLANDGVEAVEKFEKNSYDLILMDENMPRLNGRGATEQIRAIENTKGFKATPIIALTANALVGDKEKFLNAGMDDYLSKPVEPNKLKAMLALYL